MVVELTGTSKGRLTVIRRIDRAEAITYSAGPRAFNRKESWWLTLCECGQLKAMPASRIRHMTVSSCGCLRREKNARRLPLGEAARNVLFGQFRRWAKDRGIGWSLAFHEFLALTSQPCHYCGIEPSTVYGAKKFNGSYIHGGIDRIDSNKEYELTNCVAACTACNLAKRSRTQGEFRMWIVRVYHHFVEVPNAITPTP